MTSHFIGTKDFPQFMTKVRGRTRKRNEQFILMHKNEPVFELRPLTKKEIKEQKLMVLIQEAKEDVKAGRVYTHEQVKKMFNMK